MKYYVYWIHNEAHSDIFTEGYIGITNNPKRRYDAHKYKKQNPILENAFNKYKNLTMTILVVGLKEYCKNLEIKLRPHKEIGWNISPGGGMPPSRKGKSNPHTEESKQKLKDSWTKRKENGFVSRQGYRHSEETKLKIKTSNIKTKKLFKPIGRKHNSDSIEKIKISNKNAPKFECKYCKKLYLKQHLNKYHGEKCKFKMEKNNEFA